MSNLHRRMAPINVRELSMRAAALTGHRVATLAKALGVNISPDKRTTKGLVGQLVERALGADPNACERPDFPDLGIELKTIPVDCRGVPLESTFCCSIHMGTADQQSWETSRLKQRLACVLWVPVQAPRSVPLGERVFGVPRLWQPTEREIALLRGDWEEHMGLIGAGHGAALSARRGEVLQVRPKAAHSRVRTWAPGPDGPEALLPLGFYLRARFTATLLRD